MARPDHDVEAFLRASRALVAVAVRSLADVDVTLPQYRVLVVLSSASDLTGRQLADRLGVHPSTVTRMIDRLARKRLVRRVPGVADRRETALTLTAGGRRLVATVSGRRRREIAAVLTRMTAADRDAATAALLAFSEAAGEPPIDAVV
jgi:DNA-binding MarR family transcriptional regulator